MKKGCVLCMALILVLGSMTAAFAATTEGGGSGAGTPPSSGNDTKKETQTTDITVKGYTVTSSSST